MMNYFEEVEKPSKEEQLAAMESYDALEATLESLHSENPEIEIEETSEKIRIPLKALKLLAKILKATGQGIAVSVVPVAAELTTQVAADLLGCSRPHLVKLLEEGKIPFTKVGKHRRIRYEDIAKYKRVIKARQEANIIKMMQSDEKLGLYDS